MSPQLHTDNLFNSSGCLTLSALERYRDKHLGAKEQERVRSHLLGCEMCSDALEGLIMLPAGTSAGPGIREVNARLRKRYRYTPAGLRGDKKGPRINQFIIPAAASIILLAGIIGYFNYFLPKTQDLAMAETEEVIAPTGEEKELALEQQPTTQQAPKVTTTPPAIGGVAGENSKQAGDGTVADHDVVIITETNDDLMEEITIDKTDNESLALAEEKTILEAPSPSMAEMEDDQVYMMEAGKSESRAKRRAEEEVQEEEALFTAVETMPEFPGGMDSLYRFIQSNLSLPYDSSGQRSGTTYVTFTVNTDGSISDITIVRGIWEALNQEIIKMLEKMPSWTPGKQRGKPVAVQMALPIKYSPE